MADWPLKEWILGRHGAGREDRCLVNKNRENKKQRILNKSRVDRKCIAHSMKREVKYQAIKKLRLNSKQFNLICKMLSSRNNSC